MTDFEKLLKVIKIHNAIPDMSISINDGELFDGDISVTYRKRYAFFFDGRGKCVDMFGWNKEETFDGTLKNLIEELKENAA